MNPVRGLAYLSLVLAAVPVASSAVAAPPPKLVIVISVDQLGADLWDEYRAQWTGGFARLAQGTVYRNGYQSHANTETCPGHAAIGTGTRPARNGIIANGWYDATAPRPKKDVYCAEDERAPSEKGRDYLLSAAHLRVPTLGDRLKAASPASRVVAVAGKDRSAVMMGGKRADQWIFRDGKKFRASDPATAPAGLAQINEAIARQLAQAQPPLDPPPFCQRRARPIAVDDHAPVGAGAFARAAGDWDAFRASPAFDGATLALAAASVRDLKLGKGKGTDLLAIGLSATDIVGHSYGSEGQEMCLNLFSLDRDLGDFFAELDRMGIDYAVALTADHGVADLPERERLRGDPLARRIDPDLNPKVMSAAVRLQTGMKGPIIVDYGVSGDLYLDPSLKGAERARALEAAIAAYRAHSQVEAVFSKKEIAATPIPSGDPSRWSLIERVRASFDPARSGDFYVVLKEAVTPIGHVESSVATHGSPWDHDRRVPIVFYRKGEKKGAVRDQSAEVVDIAPTLARLIALPVAAGEFDGRCLDGVAGVVCPTLR